ncbi:Cytochrome P450 76A2 [Spatholobus suberectus]|nr:Cytochrome P450 76A2 [Spatholobus suberectus]
MAWTSDYSPLFFLLLFLSLSLLFLIRRKTPRSRRLPPGPPGWPIFGNMFQLGDMPHRTLADLRDKYGPVAWLQIGAINTMAILSADAAAVFFKHHDHAFADRTITETMRVHSYDKSSLALAPYGPYWRLMQAPRHRRHARGETHKRQRLRAAEVRGRHGRLGGRGGAQGGARSRGPLGAVRVPHDV